MAAVTADRVVVELEAKLDKYSANVANAQRQFDRSMGDIERKADSAEKKTTGSLDKIGEGATRNAALFTRAGVAIGAAAGAIAAGLLAAGIASINFAANLAVVSRQTGLTVEQLQILRRAGIENGFSMDQAASAVERLQEKLGDARSGVSSAVRELKSIGITDQQIASIRNAADLLPIVADRISEMRSRSEQAAAAERLGLSDLLPLLQQGADGYARYADEARRAGLITDEQARRAEEAKRRLDDLANTLQTNLASGLLSALEYSDNFNASLDRMADRASNAARRLLELIGVQGQANTLPQVPQAGQGLLGRAVRYNPVTAPLGILGDMLTAPANGAAADIVGQLTGIFGQAQDAARRFGGRALGTTDAPGRGSRGRSPTDTTDRFNRELDRLNLEILRARLEFAENEEERVDIQRQLDSAEYEARLRQIQSIKATTTEQRQAQANAINALNRLYGREPDGTIRSDGIVSRQTNREYDERVARQRAELERQALDAEVDHLRIADQLADTQAERRHIQERLLDAEERRLQIELDAITGSTAEANARRALIQSQLDAARANRAGNLELIRRQTAGPGEAYLDRINAAGNAIDEATQQVAVNGLERLNDELADSIAGFLKLGGVAGDVLNEILTGILRIAIQQQIIRPLANSLFGGGGGLFGGGGGGFDPLAFGAKILGASGGFSGLGFASGGRPPVGMASWVGERGPELFVPDGAGTIVPQGRAFSGVPGMASPGAASQLVTVRLDVSPDLRVEMAEQSAGIAIEVVERREPQTVARSVSATFQRLRRPPIPG